jgi:hypothetical protein
MQTYIKIPEREVWRGRKVGQKGMMEWIVGGQDCWWFE